MIAIKAHFDGQKIILPEEAQTAPPGEVILVFPDRPAQSAETQAWMKVQEDAFAKAWNNQEDAIYDQL